MRIDFNDIIGEMQLAVAQGLRDKTVSLLKLHSFLFDYQVPEFSCGSWLHYAIHYYRTDMIETLLEAGFDINAMDRAGQTPLVLAIVMGEHDSALTLLDCGADPCQGKREGRTALRWAAELGHASVLRRLLEKLSGTDISGDMYASLCSAVSHGRRASVELLLQAGADPYFEPEYGLSALELAQRRNSSASNYKETITLLTTLGQAVRARRAVDSAGGSSLRPLDCFMMRK